MTRRGSKNAAPSTARPKSRSLGLSLDPDDARSLYQQLFDEIVSRISTSAFPPGFRLPPTRQLSEELDVHRNTVVRAYRDLEEAGFVESTVGRGTFVKALPRASAASPRVTATPASTSEATPPSTPLPWASLLAERATSEPIRRIARRTKRPLFGPAIDLSRLQPGPDLLPTKLLTRCMEHVLDRSGGRALGYAPLEGAASLREQIAAGPRASGRARVGRRRDRDERQPAGARRDRARARRPGRHRARAGAHVRRRAPDLRGRGRARRKACPTTPMDRSCRPPRVVDPSSCT